MGSSTVSEFLQNLEYEAASFGLKASVHHFDSVDYGKVYSLHMRTWGIDSPACILYRENFADHPYQYMLPSNLGENGLIAINKESVSNPRFIHFLEQHEFREHFLRKKVSGMKELDDADYMLEPHLRKRPAHRQAVFFDFSLAHKEGVLEEYWQWWNDFYTNDHQRVTNIEEGQLYQIGEAFPVENRRQLICLLIERNRALRNEIYQLVLQGKRIEL